VTRPGPPRSGRAGRRYASAGGCEQAARHHADLAGRPGTEGGL